MGEQSFDGSWDSFAAWVRAEEEVRLDEEILAEVPEEVDVPLLMRHTETLWGDCHLMSGIRLEGPREAFGQLGLSILASVMCMEERRVMGTLDQDGPGQGKLQRALIRIPEAKESAAGGLVLRPSYATYFLQEHPPKWAPLSEFPDDQKPNLGYELVDGARFSQVLSFQAILIEGYAESNWRFGELLLDLGLSEHPPLELRLEHYYGNVAEGSADLQIWVEGWRDAVDRGGDPRFPGDSNGD